MSVTDLNQTDWNSVVDVCFNLHMGFHDYCFFSVTDQLVLWTVSVASHWKIKKSSFTLQHDH